MHNAYAARHAREEEPMMHWWWWDGGAPVPWFGHDFGANHDDRCARHRDENLRIFAARARTSAAHVRADAVA